MRSLFPAVALALAVAFAGGDADARRGRARFHPDWEKHASTRYAAMDAPTCTAELTRRGVAFSPVTEAPGVRIPVRLPKDVGGVVYRTEAPEHIRQSGPYDVFDCRLVLALSDFSRVLLAHDIEEARIFSAWRPVSSGSPAGGPAPAKHAADGEGTRHAGGLAVDVARFGKRVAAGETERTWLVVDKDFHGRIGAPVCGPGAAPPVPATAEAREIRSIACEAADQHFFTSILTPNYDRAHRNHFHLEVTPEVRWYLVL
jgi:hypothetical protein